MLRTNTFLSHLYNEAMYSTHLQIYTWLYCAVEGCTVQCSTDRLFSMSPLSSTLSLVEVTVTVTDLGSVTVTWSFIITDTKYVTVPFHKIDPVMIAKKSF